MNYLHIFEEYRKGSGSLPIQPITKEDFQDLLHIHCKQFLEVTKNINFKSYDKFSGPKKLLFRRFKDRKEDFLLTNPKESEHRRIAPWSELGNWHNLIISNLDSWVNYPRRNKSLITAGWYRADMHRGSTTYLVIPFDTTKIGVCSTLDFWEFFNVYKKGLYISNWISRVVTYATKYNNITLENDDSWEDIKPILDKKYPNEDIEELFEYYNENKSLLENLNYNLEPDLNGFSLENFKGASKLQESNCRECWFEDEALLVNWEVFLNIY